MFITLTIASAAYTGEETPLHPVISVDGDTITYNGQEFDLSGLPEGSVAEAEYPAIGEVKREEGVISITLHYPYVSINAEPNQPIDPEHYKFNVESGEVPCPIIWREQNVQAIDD